MTIKNTQKSKIAEDLEHKHYGVFNHSAVEICEWNKKALRGQGHCYKQKFYNVDCHRCAQITPTVIWCHQKCIFCWRPSEYMSKHKLTGNIDKPKEIIDRLFELRKKLLSGFGGYKKTKKKMYEESLIPSHVAISLSGEPTIYPYLGEMIRYLKSKKEIKSIFIVTNGMEPKNIEKLAKEKSLPTQLYLSIVAPNELLHIKINKPKIKDSWKILQTTISLMAKLKCRRVVRFTLIKGINDDPKYLKDYVKLFEKTNADFIEIKAYMCLGYSRKTLTLENMPRHEECKRFAEEFEKLSEKYKISDECETSRIVLLKNKKSKYKNFIK